MNTATVCAVCRHHETVDYRSVCDTCVPPDEGELIARAQRKRAATFLKRAAAFLATCRRHNTDEWMEQAASQMNEWLRETADSDRVQYDRESGTFEVVI
ncbi:MAG: hypothetical protein KGL39_34535 [Patescibacteria group bacterium]|nr:hypothetical protein [Patescibacteria group bacterium]